LPDAGLDPAVIIVEGPDASGKSTLVEKLQKKLEINVRNRHVDGEGGFTGDPIRWVNEEMRAWPAVTGLYDRFPLLGEPIYGPIIRGRIYEEFADSAYMALLDHFFHLKPLVIYCLPPQGAVRKQFEATKATQPKWLQQASQRQRDGIYAAYWMQMMWLEVVMRDRVLVWDWTHPNVDVQFEKIVGRARLVVATYGRA
jgi:hypothetical protein